MTPESSVNRPPRRETSRTLEHVSIESSKSSLPVKRSPTQAGGRGRNGGATDRGIGLVAGFYYEVARGSMAYSPACRTRAAFDCDVIVAGGGPAGSAASAWLARARSLGQAVRTRQLSAFPHRRVPARVGQRCPRRHWRGRSRAARVVSGKVGRDVHAGRRTRRAVRRLRHRAWRADAADLAGAARRLRRSAAAPRRVAAASRCTSGTASLDVAFDADGVTATVQRPRRATGTASRVRARAIIDASGRGGLLSRKFGLRIDEPRLANIAVFSHYSGVPRQTGRRSGDIRIVSRGDLGWFWLIPISGELMSVGVVLPRAAFRAQAVAGSRGAAGARDRGDAGGGGAAGAVPGGSGRCASRRTSRSARARMPAIAGCSPAMPVRFSIPCFRPAWPSRSSPVSRRRRPWPPGWRRATCPRGASVGSPGASGSGTSRSGGSCSASTPRNSAISSSARTRRRTCFASLVSVFAGYWQPAFRTRCWVALFFGLVRLQRWLRFAPSFRVHHADQSRSDSESPPRAREQHRHAPHRGEQRWTGTPPETK